MEAYGRVNKGLINRLLSSLVNTLTAQPRQKTPGAISTGFNECELAVTIFGYWFVFLFH
jgi:hypothetical protein